MCRKELLGCGHSAALAVVCERYLRGASTRPVKELVKEEMTPLLMSS